MSMPTADSSNVLFKIAHPDLYERNPFNLLNLPINATARDIRRCKEDIEAAFDAGTEAEEFRFVLPVDANRRPPTREAVNEAFEALNEPELRIAYALFWFWPDERNPQIKGSDIDERTVVSWGKTASGFGLVQRHNLAVYKHLSALSTDKGLQKQGFCDALDVFAQWKETIELWNATVKEADFWHSVSEMVLALNDPRLDYRFARSLRDQFAFAFDQINVELAIDFAKAGREAEAKLQVEYMRLSQPDADDVEGTFDDAFGGLLRQTEAICKAAQDETDKKPQEGLLRAKILITQTSEPLRISRIILEPSAFVRNAIATTIFSAVRHCLVAYGNTTNDWNGCLKLCKDLKSIAETPEQVKLVASDCAILERNKKAKDEEERCPFCGQRYSPSNPRQSQTFHLWGNLRKGTQFWQVTYSQRSLEVSMCKSCATNPNRSCHPDVKNLIDAGWHLGDRPLADDVNVLWEQRPIAKPGVSSPQSVRPVSVCKDESSEQQASGCIIGAIKIILRFILAVLLRLSPLLIIIFLLYCCSNSSNSKSSSTASRSTANGSQLVREDESLWQTRMQTPPANGTVRRFHYGTADSPLKVTTSYGVNYFVKIVNPYTGSTIVDVYIVGGQSVEIDVPSGTYEIRYASGKNWYGHKYLFGPRTSYSKTNRYFTFSKGSGYEITLYKVRNGNLSTSTISAEDF